MKKSLFSLPVKKLLLLLLPKFYISILGKESKLFFEQDKRQRQLWWQIRKRLQPIRPAYVELHTYGGRCCFVAILKNMKNIKNFVSANCVMVLTSKVAVLTLAGKGGAL
jgi:hypothetical protein